jgi:hypothetical protein
MLAGNERLVGWELIMAGDGSWWSIEVLDGPFSAERWRDAHGRALFEAAVTHGALDWSWHVTDWGLVLEVEFPDSEAWSAFRRLPAVQAALDAVPDPVRGLFVFPGRGGTSGAFTRSRPRPKLGAGGAALPESVEPEIIARIGAVMVPGPNTEAVPHAPSIRAA